MADRWSKLIPRPFLSRSEALLTGAMVDAWTGAMWVDSSAGACVGIVETTERGARSQAAECHSEGRGDRERGLGEGKIVVHDRGSDTQIVEWMMLMSGTCGEYYTVG